MKKFFKIESEYKFEWNDLRALLQIVNVMLIVFADLMLAPCLAQLLAVQVY